MSGSGNDPAAEAMIEAVGISKFYGDFIAVKDVSFRIPGARLWRSWAPTVPARAPR